ncbi:MAG: cell division protein, partial [Bacteroidota bacterium]
KNEWIMYPQVGQHKFDLGTLAKMKEKLYLLRQAYYKEILPRKGWGAYRTISVRYDGQVVCR